MDIDPKIARHKLLLTTISDEIGSSGEEFDNFVEHFKGYVPPGLLSGKRTLLGKFAALANKGHLAPGKYDVLKKISKDSGNNNILELIEAAENDIRNQAENDHRPTNVAPSGLNASGQQTIRSETSGQRAPAQQTYNDEPEKKRVRIDGSDNLYTREGNRGYYDNTGKKGLLLILNFTENRKGTELDVSNLKEFFGPEGLNFDIDDPREGEQDDLTKSQVDAALEEAQNKLNRTNPKRYYCFVCVILSHGDEEGIKTRDLIKPINEIQKSFNNRNIPNFTGRPKLFFIQACRGRADQRGQHVDDADDEVKPNAAENNYVDEADDIVYIPTDADTLTAYATTLGYRSFRRQNVGSWFIKECMNVFKNYYQQDHVEEMLITVRGKVALSWVKEDGTKQMPCVNSTLTQRLKFTKSE